MNKSNIIDYGSPSYKRSRFAYTSQCTFEYFASLLLTDAFLAKLLTSIGISDTLVGIISSVISLAFLVQLMSIFLIKSTANTKRIVIIMDTFSQVLFMLMYFIPFMNVSSDIKKLFVISFIMLGYFLKYFIYSIYFKWANSFVAPTNRATFGAIKEIISLISGIIFTAIFGYIIDSFESVGNLNGGFLFIAGSMLIINICNFVSLALIKKEDKKETNEDRIPLKEVIANTIGNKAFRNIIILTVLWDIARYTTMGFMGTFKTKDLMLSVFFIQMINMIANLCRIFASQPFGKYSDRRSFAKGFELALCFAALAFFANIFTTKSFYFPVIIYTILFSISQAGTNQNSFNIVYSYVDSRYISQAMAIKNSMGGICGFGASLLASRILALVQANGNMVFGIKIFGQQLLSGISFIITIVLIFFVHFVIAKKKVRIQ